jgi:hypothetical protein
MATKNIETRYVYTDYDGTGRQDPAMRAYGSAYVGEACERDGPWWGGKALVRFANGARVVVRARLLRRVRP